MLTKYTVILVAVTEPMLVARITVLLRKYDVHLNSLQRDTLPQGQEQLTLTVENQRDNMAVAMSKLERLVPVVSLQYQPVKP
jgi:glycine cleavage system regulatory protein